RGRPEDYAPTRGRLLCAPPLRRSSGSRRLARGHQSDIVARPAWTARDYTVFLVSPARVPEESTFPTLKRLLVGSPIPSHLAHHERLARVPGLAVLSSDALSSVAYATEEILRVLILVGAAALGYASPIAFVIAAILAIVVFSYRQTIQAYPSGGGAYLVSKDNLGEMPALIAAASLLIDYVLTVAVSIAAGGAALLPAVPEWHVNRVEMTLAFVVLLMLGNLRGIRESGRIFSVPTYFFIVATLALIAVGAWRALAG